jgi:predicted PurR-regulated permease PerM
VLIALVLGTVVRPVVVWLHGRGLPRFTSAIIQLLLDRFAFQPATLAPVAATDRDLASRLRYEAQDLAQDLRKQARHTKAGSALKIKQIDQVMDEIETITTDLDALLAQVPRTGAA